MFEERVICIDKSIVELEKKVQELANDAAELHGLLLWLELESLNKLDEEWISRIGEACHVAKEVDLESFLLSHNITRLKLRRSFKTHLPQLIKEES